GADCCRPCSSSPSASRFSSGSRSSRFGRARRWRLWLRLPALRCSAAPSSRTATARAGSLLAAVKCQRCGPVSVTGSVFTMEDPFTRPERRLIALWEEHLRLEFTQRDAAATVATMSVDNYVNHVPVMTGGRSREEMLEFYGRHFIPKMPADTEI